MALDWNKEITLPGSKKKQGGAGALPTKTTMNLAPTRGGQRNVGRTILLGILLALLIALFAKFGVIDQYARVDSVRAQLSQQQALEAAMQAQLANYDEVQQEYELYVSENSAEEEELTVEAMTALRLIDEQIKPYASVGEVHLNGNELGLVVGNITLDALGRLATALEENDIVAKVMVSTAATETMLATDVTASMNITLQVPGAVAAADASEEAEEDTSTLETIGQNAAADVGNIVGSGGATPGLSPNANAGERE